MIIEALGLSLYVAAAPFVGAVIVGVLCGLFSKPLPNDDGTIEGDF